MSIVSRDNTGSSRSTTAGGSSLWHAAKSILAFFDLGKGTPFLAGMVVFAAALFASEITALDGAPETIAFFVALNCLAAMLPVNVYGDTYVTASLVITMPLIALYGPAGAALAAPLQAVAGSLGLSLVKNQQNKRTLRQAIRGTLSSAAIATIVLTASAFVYQAFDSNVAEVTLATVPAVIGATLCWFGLNVALLSASRAAAGRGSFRAVVEQHLWLLPHTAAMGVMGLVLIASYEAIGGLGVIAFATPALMMRMVMKQYTDKTEDNVVKLRDQNKALTAANIQIKQVSDELRESYDATLETLVSALDARDQETKGHSIRVSHYMLDIAREMGVKEGTTDWVDMARGSLLHDVGKIGVSDSILLKPGKLTDDEWTLMRLHPEIGFNMLKQVKFLAGAAELVLCHHERWDGKGYPRGLGHEEIPLGARIFTVVDTFDSMTSDRPYRKALSTLESMNEILRHSGTQFDPMVVEAFLDTYEAWVKSRDEMHASVDLRAAA